VDVRRQGVNRRGDRAMERDVLARLKSLVDGGRIEPIMFFRLCALMGVSFAAAMSSASASPAFAMTLASISPAPSGYVDLIDPHLAAYVDAAGTTDGPTADEFDDHFFVKKSGEPFSKFDKAPD
jgi:hypothetical protein